MKKTEYNTLFFYQKKKGGIPREPGLDVFCKKSEGSGKLEAVEIREIPNGTDKASKNLREYTSDAIGYIYQMSLERKLAQLFLVCDPSQEEIEKLKEYGPGGFLLGAAFAEGKNENHWKEAAGTLFQTQGTPFLLIGTEQPGNSLSEALTGNAFPDFSQMYRQSGANGILQKVQERAQWANQIGLHALFGPSTDETLLSSNNGGFGDDFYCLLTTNAVSLCQEENLSLILHPFPASYVQENGWLPVNDSPYEEFLYKDYNVFYAGLNANADCVFLPNCIYSSVDPDLPASLSRRVMDMIENSCVILSDDLSSPLLEKLELEEPASLIALKAGAHLFCTSHFQKDYTELLNAVKKDESLAFTVDMAAAKVVAWKMKLGLIS